ncbi:putative PH-like domain superfamily protein [Plasmopara halstedii]
MSYGGNVEGYLLKIDGDEARTVYCILDEGILQYFSRMGGELLGAIALSGSKVPHQFRVDAQSRNLPNRRRNNRQPMNDGKIRTITFAGSTREVADQWAISILNWNRYSWEDGQIICSSKDEYRNLQKIISRSGTTNEKTTESVVPITVSPAVRPL